MKRRKKKEPEDTPLKKLLVFRPDRKKSGKIERPTRYEIKVETLKIQAGWDEETERARRSTVTKDQDLTAGWIVPTVQT